MKKSEQRREPRHLGKLPVELESGGGMTRDFNGSGVFFETDRPFSIGQPVEFTFVLKYFDPEHPVRMKCHGEIVRVEECGQKLGVAATIDSYTFEELKQNIQPEVLTEYSRNEATKNKTKKSNCKNIV